MKRRHLLVFVLVLLTFPCSFTRAEEKPIRLTYANFFPSQNPIFQSTVQWAKEIEKRTNGRVQIRLYPGGSLLTADKIYEGIVRDTCDIGLTCLSYTRGRFPLMEVLDMPLGYPNTKVVYRVMWEIYKKFRPKELADIKMLYIVTHEPGCISFASERVTRLEQLKGKKIRSTGTSAAIVRALGASPVAMTMGNAYMALSKGVVDGTINSFTPLKSFKLAEVTKSSIYHPNVGYATVMIVGMNLEKWNSMPTDIQIIFEEISEQWLDRTALISHQLAQDGYDYAKSLGHEFIFLEDNPKEAERWISSVGGIIEAYKEKMRKMGLPGEDVVKEAKRLIKYYSKMDKYGGPPIIR
jgi:TRAP-type transport system periplasmic protein